MAKATSTTETIVTGVTLTLTKDEAEKVLAIVANALYSDTGSIYDALKNVGVKSNVYSVKTRDSFNALSNVGALRLSKNG